MPTKSSLPGLDKLIAVLSSHGENLEMRPPDATAPHREAVVLGEPLDPLLASFYARLNGGQFGDLYVYPGRSLEPINEEARDRSPERIHKLCCFAALGGPADSFATVPSLAAPDGHQPVVLLQSYLDKTILPFASHVDRAFELYAQHCEAWIQLCGSLEKDPPLEHDVLLFPRSYVSDIARDSPLVQLLADGRFDELVLPDEASREWVRSILNAASTRG